MATPNAHMLEMPKHFMIVRRLQLSFSVALLGLSISGILGVEFNSLIFTLVTAICSCIVYIWIICATRCAPKAFNYWAVLSLEIFLLVFWFISMVLDAILAAYVSYYVDAVTCTRYNYYGQCISSYRSGYATAYVGVLIATAILSAGIFILCLTSLILVSIAINRHRKAGGHSKMVEGGTTHNVTLAPMYANPNDQGMGKMPPSQEYPGHVGYYGQQPGMPSPATHYQPPPAGNYQGPPAPSYQGPPAPSYQGPPSAYYQAPPATHYQVPTQ